MLFDLVGLSVCAGCSLVGSVTLLLNEVAMALNCNCNNSINIVIMFVTPPPQEKLATALPIG